ncbi:hypothetical protein K501DRAFT_308149 [Backusella circina FSU 941]|nr:hypothetical protein K501DRAFT_308149 [Backusella circina FSU 941]
MACPTCSSVIGIRFLGDFVHQGSKSIGLLQLAGCTAFDLLPSHYTGTCGECMTDMTNTLRLSPHDSPQSLHCFSCHAKMNIGLNDYRFVLLGQALSGKMSRKDPHKHKGIGKTVSKKQDRVGAAGKERNKQTE